MASSVSTALKQPASMFSFLHIESFREGSFLIWGGGGDAIGRFIKRVKTATAKWIRVDISPCQLWHGYLPEGTQRRGGMPGMGERRRGVRTLHCSCRCPSVYTCRSPVELSTPRCSGLFSHTFPLSPLFPPCFPNSLSPLSSPPSSKCVTRPV